MRRQGRGERDAHERQCAIHGPESGVFSAHTQRIGPSGSDFLAFPEVETKREIVFGLTAYRTQLAGGGLRFPSQLAQKIEGDVRRPDRSAGIHPLAETAAHFLDARGVKACGEGAQQFTQAANGDAQIVQRFRILRIARGAPAFSLRSSVPMPDGEGRDAMESTVSLLLDLHDGLIFTARRTPYTSLKICANWLACHCSMSTSWAATRRISSKSSRNCPSTRSTFCSWL